MKIVVAICALVSLVQGGVVPAATTLLRTPSYDTSIVKSSRAGSSFAYSTLEGHAYVPITQSIVGHQPVAAISYAAHVPAGYATAPITFYQHPIYQHPIFSQQQLLTSPIFAQNPGIFQHPIFGGVGPQYPPQYPAQYPGPIQQFPTQPGPIQQFPTQPGPIQQFPTQPGPIQQFPTQPVPVQPQPPQQPAGQPAPTPVQGTVVDDDTVAVDSA